MKLKFQTVAEKTAKNFRGLLYFAAPGILAERCRQTGDIYRTQAEAAVKRDCSPIIAKHVQIEN